jgi:hypothetical protein
LCCLRTKNSGVDDHASPDTSDPEFVIEKLLSADRGGGALTWVGAHPNIAVPSGVVAGILRHASTMKPDQLVGGGVMYQHYVQALFKRLDDDPTVSEQEIAGLEWTYYRLLEHTDRPAKQLHRALATDPNFFVYLLGIVYDLEIVPTEETRKVASQAIRVLSDLAVVPGSDDVGEIDAKILQTWVGEVLKLAKERRLEAVAESKIGAILAKAIGRGGAMWPPEAVRQIIEDLKSEELEDGFYVASRNSRGVTIRRPTDGGGQERDLAAEYRAFAKSVSAAQVRTRALLNKLAESYEREADGEDQSAEQRDW